MTEPRIPDWLLVEERREPPKDRDVFLRRSADALRALLREIRSAPERRHGKYAFSTTVRLAFTFVVVLLVSAARNFAFVELVGAGLLALLATYHSKKLVRVLAAPVQAFILAAIILAPSLFWGQTRAFVVVPCKAFITTAALAILAYSTNWNRFTCAFKAFGAPDALVFIFDLTLKYVVVLGEICLETLDAVRLRSVGRNRRKTRTLGGVVGGVFWRAQKMAQEQYDAMTCRCFAGKYRRFRAPFRAADLLALALCLVLIALFIYLEYAIRCSN